MFKEVEDFNKQIIGLDRQLGHRIDPEEVEFFVGLLGEEIGEFKEAWTEKDYVKQIDALIDLMYFAAGGLVRLGVPSKHSETIFQIVHNCNMNKKKGVKEEREVTGETDAVKPTGWTSPEEAISELLQL